MNIYFVCTGNTCRSPMAAAILASKNLSDIAVKSAGIYAMDGQLMSANAQLALAEENILVSHKSNQVNKEDVEWADLILTMTARHKEWLTHMYSESTFKIYTLNEYVYGSTKDVIDPYGGDLAIYKQTYVNLTNAIDKLLIQLNREE